MPRTTGYAQTVEQDVHTTSAIPRAILGEKVQTADGRTYRYAKNAGTALDAGKLTVAATVVANHTNIAVAIADVGTMQMTVTLGATAVAINEYSEGYVVINDSVGEGIMYKISSHPAAASGASLELTLEDPLRVALTAASEASLVKNTYDSVVISAVGQANLAVGVPNVAVPANEYCWIQTGGACAVLGDEAVAAGLSLTIGTGAAGAVEALDAVAEQVVGVATDAVVDTEYRRVELRLDN